MKIGLLIAIERELKAFLLDGGLLTEETVGGRRVYHTRMGGNEVYALRSGWGEIDAAAGTQLLITGCGCEAILNFGVTGALDPSLKVEDLFVVSKVLHYDFDTSLIDDVAPHQYEGEPDAFMRLDKGLMARAKALWPGLREAAVASGDRFVADRAFKEELYGKGCDICDMEIAAIARVCRLNGVPCLSIKCISDTYDGDGKDFEKNVERSAARSFAVLRQVLENPEV